MDKQEDTGIINNMTKADVAQHKRDCAKKRQEEIETATDRSQLPLIGFTINPDNGRLVALVQGRGVIWGDVTINQSGEGPEATITFQRLPEPWFVPWSTLERISAAEKAAKSSEGA